MLFFYLDTSYLKGLSILIAKFESGNEKEKEEVNTPISDDRENKFIKERNAMIMSKIFSPKHTNKPKPINSPKNYEDKRSEDLLESFYSNLGHEYYTKILKIFEKYCFFGKVNTNFEMDFSQFSTFMKQNGMYDSNLEEQSCALIFNKIKGSNKLINFEDFIKIIIEFARKEFEWEKDHFKAFKYFINRRINHFPCLEPTFEEKNLERFYFFLEYDDYQQEIKKLLPCLKRCFTKYKHSDLRISECISSDGFIKMCKDLTIVPVFMSSKEVVDVINYVKYHKKTLFPTGNISFCSFCEVLCLIAFQSFDKYSQEEHQKKYVDHIDKLKIFLKFLIEKIN